MRAASQLSLPMWTVALLALAWGCGAKSALETHGIDAAAPAIPRDVGPDAPPLATFPCRWSIQDPVALGPSSPFVDTLIGAVHTRRDEVLVFAGSATAGAPARVALLSLGIDGRARVMMARDVVRSATDIVPTEDQWAVFDGSSSCRVTLIGSDLRVVSESDLEGVDRCRADGAEDDGGVLIGAAGVEARVERVVRGSGREPIARLVDSELARAPARPVVGSGGAVFAAWPIGGRAVGALFLTDREFTFRTLPRVTPSGERMRIAAEPLRGGAVLLAGAPGGLGLFALRDASLTPELLTMLEPDTQPIDPRISTNETEAIFAVRGGDVVSVPLNGASERRIAATSVDARLATVVLRRGTSVGGELYVAPDASGAEQLFWRNLVCNR